MDEKVMPEANQVATKIDEGSIQVRRWKDVGEVPADIWSSLKSFPRSDQTKKEGWYPASAVLKNGTRIDCVAFVERGSEAQDKFYTQTGFLRRKYEFDSSRMIDVSSVTSVQESPYKTPLAIQTKMEKLRVPGCKITLKDGKEYWLESVLDEFINIPKGYEAKDVIDVTEVSEKDRKYFPSPDFRIWADIDPYRSLGPIHLSLSSLPEDTVGWHRRIMLCFFNRPKERGFSEKTIGEGRRAR